MDPALDDATRTEVAPAAAPAPRPASIPRASSIPDEGRFAPGSLLAGRYRISGLLGRGGMGEVYRAFDLTLAQPVALKFLPEAAASNQRLLERFHGEVRVARQVSHSNVCRVYDVGEAEGLPFISMEYVDGEDLAALLQRIGRLPSDKALETARQICAGLAAAHTKGVIHRDLKPANIMIDRKGQAVIMDFGLAAVASQIDGPEARSGTPAYMSPEQLRGTEVTARSDIYALGLVLYELFTGKRPFEARNVAQLLEKQESAQFPPMSSAAADIDPLIEKTVRRCLDPLPANRQASPLDVSRALPGGDPLAAALAAGHTPSPDLVAAAGGEQGMPRKWALVCLCAVLAVVAAAPFLKQRGSAFYRAGLEHSPEVLASKAREFAASFGYPAKPGDSTVWLTFRGGLLAYLSKRRPADWDAWMRAEAPISAWYRESPGFLVALPRGDVRWLNPAPLESGMVEVEIDGHGRLRGFQGHPHLHGASAGAAVPPEKVFQAAGLDLSKFTETEVNALPRHPTDVTRAWTGQHPSLTDVNLTVVLGWWRGQLTFVKVVWPWMRADGSAAPMTGLLTTTAVFQTAGLVLGTLFMVLLAKRNWKLGRCDKRGAFRLGAARFFLGLAQWACLFHPVPDTPLISIFFEGVSASMLDGAVVWLLYLALEPSMRARWPHAIVTWNRVLAGRWKDARVCGDLLVGAAAGAILWMAGVFISAAAGQVGLGGLYPPDVLGARQWFGGISLRMGAGLEAGLGAFFILFGLRTLLRRDWLAAAAGAVCFTVLQVEAGRTAEWQVAAFYLVLFGALVFVLLRVGMLASLSALFTLNTLGGAAIGTDLTAWFAPFGIATLAAMTGVSLLAFRQALGNRDLFGEEESA